MELTKAAGDVLAERTRQVMVEGWRPEHDNTYTSGELVLAAGAYALYGSYPAHAEDPPVIWPWAAAWWKPRDKRRNLVKAAALILAEIERLDRAAPPYGPDNPPRLRGDLESVEEYRSAMGWDTKTPNS
jgi:hypothetical protein